MSIEPPPVAVRPKIIGLGHACDVAYQIRRVTLDETSYFFDWLMTPSNSCNLMELDWDNFLKPQNWMLSGDGGGVIDKATGIEFRHHFKKVPNAGNLLDVPLIDSQMEEVESKFLYLRNATLAAIKSKNYVYLVRQEGITHSDEAAVIAEKILSAYVSLNPLVRLIIASPNAASEAFNPYYIFVKSKARPSTDVGWWCGDDDAWNRVFNLAHNWFQFHKFRDLSF